MKKDICDNCCISLEDNCCDACDYAWNFRQKEIDELKKQIDKIKCCQNCKHSAVVTDVMKDFGNIKSTYIRCLIASSEPCMRNMIYKGYNKDFWELKNV